jgi:WD40 repeat protein
VGIDRTVFLYRIASNAPAQEIDTGEQVNLVLFSPNDRYIALASGEYVRLVRLDKKSDAKIYRYSSWIYSLAFSSDSSLLAVGNASGMVRVIDTDTGEEKSAFSYGQRIYDLAFSKSGGKPVLLSATGDTVYQDLLLSTDLKKEACDRLFSNLSRSQWNDYVPGTRYQSTCPSLPVPE